MSDNTEILILKKKDGKWEIYHHTIDSRIRKEDKIACGFKDLEKAVDFANKWVKDFYENGFEPEYGTRIIKGRY